MEAALAILNLTEKNLIKVFAGVGKNIYSLDMRDIIDFVQANSPITQADLMTYFQTSAEPAKLLQLIEGLAIMKKSKRDINDQGGYTITYTGG